MRRRVARCAWLSRVARLRFLMFKLAPGLHGLWCRHISPFFHPEWKPKADEDSSVMPLSWGEHVLLVSHFAGGTDASPLLLNIARGFQDAGFNPHVVLLRDGPPQREFTRHCPIDVASDERSMSAILERLKPHGLSRVFLDTMASCVYAEYFKAHGMYVVTLVHEPVGVVKTMGLCEAARSQQDASDLIVVPSSQIADSWRDGDLPFPADKTRVMTQPDLPMSSVGSADEGSWRLLQPFRDYAMELYGMTVSRPLPVISCVMPNYNCARFLERRIACVMEQTYRVSELIIIDDDSTDESAAVIPELVKKYAYRFPMGIRYVRTDAHAGVFKLWVRGAELAHGDYLWIAEACDDASPLLMSRLVHAFRYDRSVKIAYAQSMLVDEAGKVLEPNFLRHTADISRTFWLKGWIVPAAELMRRGLSLRKVIPSASGVLMDRQSLLDSKDEMHGCAAAGDWVAYMNIADGGAVAFWPESLNLLRRRRRPVSASGRQQVADGIYKAHQYIIGKFNPGQAIMAAMRNEYLKNVGKLSAVARPLDVYEVGDWREGQETFDTVISLGCNCEVSYSIYRIHGSVDSYPLSWAAVHRMSALAEFLRNPESMLRGSAFRYQRECRIWQSGIPDIWIHGRALSEELFDADGTEIPGALEKDREELVSRQTHLIEKFKDTCAASAKRKLFLVTIRSCVEKADFLGVVSALSQTCSNWKLLAIFSLEDSPAWVNGLQQIENVGFAWLRYFAPGDRATVPQHIDCAGWDEVFSKFVLAHSPDRKMRKRYKFERE